MTETMKTSMDVVADKLAAIVTREAPKLNAAIDRMRRMCSIMAAERGEQTTRVLLAQPDAEECE